MRAWIGCRVRSKMLRSDETSLASSINGRFEMRRQNETDIWPTSEASSFLRMAALSLIVAMFQCKHFNVRGTFLCKQMYVIPGSRKATSNFCARKVGLLGHP